MKKNILFWSIMFVSLFSILSCDNNDGETIIPGDISNITAEAREGAIMLRWDVPADSSYRYVRISYKDLWTGKEVIKLSSVYTDSLLIENLLNRFGDYTFSMETYSITGTPSGNVHDIKRSCIPVPAVTTKNDYQVTLTIDNLYGNAVQTNDGGGLPALLDGDGATYFHSTWSPTPQPGDVHYIQVNLDAPLTRDFFKFAYRNRANTANKPQEIKIEISEDNTNFTHLKTIDQGLPNGSGSEYNSDPIDLRGFFQPKHIRFSVLRTTNNTGTAASTIFFTMADFWLYESEEIVYDPEHNDDDL
ncbi:MAG: discoidin domain-containing protein [Prevotella sp.]|jgi:hypothetical protein|nr:discoidin domain-containing protein [Prevotella sp.]